MSSSIHIQDPPEAAGPGRYDEAGAIDYSQPATGWRIGRIPPPETNGQTALPPRCAACAGLPHQLLAAISDLSRRAGEPHRGCWHCGHAPAHLLAQVRLAIQEASQ